MSTDAIDHAHLARQSGGDAGLERELLGLFAGQCVSHLRTLRGRGDRQARLDAAHTLKGAARAIGAWPVAAAADLVEVQLAAGEGGEVEAALDALALAAGQARAAIARLDGGA